MLKHDCIDTISVSTADSGASENWKSWISAGVNLLLSDLAGIVEVFVLWQRRSAARSSLSDLDDRLLRDSGLTREQVLREINKPFWRD